MFLSLLYFTANVSRLAQSGWRVDNEESSSVCSRCTAKERLHPVDFQTPSYVKDVSHALKLRTSQVDAAIRLLNEGNTIPFIARYRKEMTGELDENELRQIAQTYDAQKNLFERKCDVLRLLDEQGVFGDPVVATDLIGAITNAKTMTEVDDIYRPYRPKRKTRASMAKARGLLPLYEWLVTAANRHLAETTVVAHAQSFVAPDHEVATVEDALQGACDIIAEQVADDPDIRRWLRQYTLARGQLKAVAVDADVESVYEAYYNFQTPLGKLQHHQVLAINRGERETFLRVSLVLPAESVQDALVQRYEDALYSNGPGARMTGRDTRPGPQSEFASDLTGDSYVMHLIQESVADAYKRLLAPAIEREIRGDKTAQAEEHAIGIFAENLKNLLLQPPIRGRVVLGVDPAYRTGCKLAVVDDTGKLQMTSVIYPTPPQSKVAEAQKAVLEALSRYGVTLIAIGNGTASREAEAFIADCLREVEVRAGSDEKGRDSSSTRPAVAYVMVNEAGASVYSASPLAGEEFPALDVSERSAVSIARRIQDPLAELVKIDPKSVGVGQYQHDVSQKRLDEQLGAVVESAVNQVGVDVNTASASLLSHVAGLNKTVAKNIVSFRDENGRFASRKALGKVPRLGPKTLEQCVGFLRIADGDEPLDATPIHPESYPAAKKLLARTGDARAFLRQPDVRQAQIRQLRGESVEALCAELGVGAPTLRDILDALERPGRDPREDVPPPILRTDVLKLEDLSIGMVLTGTVRNVVDFGAFVDIGIKNDGLVHVSHLADQFVKRPMDVVSVGDVVEVRVIQIDANKGRVGLSMKKDAAPLRSSHHVPTHKHGVARGDGGE